MNPNPDRPASGVPRTLVGRERELDEIALALTATAGGRGGLLLISGEPGIGKTRLANEAAERAQAAAITTLWGRCREAEGRPSYWPWLQILQAYVRDRDARAIAAEMDSEICRLGQMVPELRPHLAHLAPPPASESEGARFRLFDALSAFVHRMALAAPVVMIVDDLHWADLPSLRFLEFVAHGLPNSRILVLGTYREAEVRQQAALGEVLAALGRSARRLPLRGLSASEAGQFLTAAMGHPIPARVEQRLHHLTDGNPFFLDEMAHLLRSSPAVAAAGGTSHTDLPISHGIRGAIRQRLASLSVRCRAVLAMAAVAGREFDAIEIEGIDPEAGAGLHEALAEGLDLEVIERAGRPGRYRFSHALVRETIYDELSPRQRAELHRDLAGVIECRYGATLDRRLAETAHHLFEAASLGVTDKAIDYAQQAGERAMEVLAYEDAAEQFERALQLIELSSEADGGWHCRIVLSLGEARSRAGLIEESAQTFRRAAAIARRHRAPALLAQAAIGFSGAGSVWTEYGRSDGNIVLLLEEAIAALGDAEGGLRARATARLATELCWAGDPDRIDALSAAAVLLARRAGDSAALAFSLVARMHCASDPDHVDERLRLADEVLQLTSGRGDLAVNAYLWKLGDCLHLGRRGEADACLAALVQGMENLRQPRDLWLIPAARSQRALLEGALTEAESLVAPILDQPTHKPNAEQAASALMYLVRRERGEHGELAPALQSLAYRYPALNAVWRSPLAMLYADTRQYDLARGELDLLVSDRLHGVRFDLSYLFALACLSEAARACGSRQQIDTLYRALLPYAGRNVVAGPLYYLGPVAYYLGLLAAAAEENRDDAVRHLDDALAETRRLGAQPYLARALMARAELYAAIGTPSDLVAAAQMRGEAAAIALALGLRPLVDELRGPPSTADLGSEARTRRGVFRCEGEYWIVAYQGRVSRLRSLKGLKYLRRLLAAPGREFHILDLAQLEQDRESTETDSATLNTESKAALKGRLDDLREAMAEAERHNDFFRADKARAEIEEIADQLGRMVGLDGGDQRAATERARVSVSKAIRSTMKVIERSAPALAAILARTVRVGVYSSYVEIAELPIVWDLGVDGGAEP